MIQSPQEQKHIKRSHLHKIYADRKGPTRQAPWEIVYEYRWLPF